MSEPLRILHVETRHRLGGAERNALHTASWQLAAGHRVEFAVGRDSFVDDFPAAIPCHVVSGLVRSINPILDLVAIVQLRLLIRRGRYDLVHTHQSKAGILGRIAARGIAGRIVHTVHMASFGPAYGRIGSTLFRVAERYVAGFTDLFVSVGSELRDLYVGSGVGSPDRHIVIHSPIDLERFAMRRALVPEERAAAKAALGLPPRMNVALTVASLEPRKRVDLVIRRLAPALATNELVLAVAGNGPEYDRIVATANELGVTDGVRLLGHVEDVPRLFAAADVLCHAATVEGVPQVVVQALAAGVPVVATRMIGLGEVPGAPLVTVGEDGADLLSAVRRVLVVCPEPVSMVALAPWRHVVVEEQLAALHQRLFRGATGN